MADDGSTARLSDRVLGEPDRCSHHEEQLALYDRTDRAERRGFRCELLDRKQLRELVPLVGDKAIGGYFYNFGGHANPHRTVQAYAWAMQDHGGRLLQHCAVMGFRTEGERLTAVETERGVFGCDQLVIAAGPHTGRLSAMLGQEVPMASARVEKIVTEPLPLMPFGGVDGNGLYGRQTLRGKRWSARMAGPA